MQDITFALADGPEALFTIVSAVVLPDRHSPFEDSSPVVKAEASLTQRLGCLASSHSNCIRRCYARSVYVASVVCAVSAGFGPPPCPRGAGQGRDGTRASRRTGIGADAERPALSGGRFFERPDVDPGHLHHRGHHAAGGHRIARQQLGNASVVDLAGETKPAPAPLVRCAAGRRSSASGARGDAPLALGEAARCRLDNTRVPGNRTEPWSWTAASFWATM